MKLYEAKQAAISAAEACAVCGVSNTGDPVKDTFWISCDTCHRWFHGICAEVPQELLDLMSDEEGWECRNCWQQR